MSTPGLDGLGRGPAASMNEVGATSQPRRSASASSITRWASRLAPPLKPTRCWQCGSTGCPGPSPVQSVERGSQPRPVDQVLRVVADQVLRVVADDEGVSTLGTFAVTPGVHPWADRSVGVKAGVAYRVEDRSTGCPQRRSPI